MQSTTSTVQQILPDLLEFPLVPPQADGSVVEIADGLLWIRMPMPMALDHINVYLIEDSDGWFILDTGLNTRTTRRLWQQIIEQHGKGKSVKGVICTHFHYDHSGLASWLTETFDVPLYMTHGEFYILKAISSNMSALGDAHQMAFYHQTGTPLEEVEAMIEGCRKDPFMQDSPPSFNRLREGDVLTIGKRNWRVVIGEGHSPEHACLYSEQDKILLAGDQLLPHISSNVLISELEPQGKQLENWLNSLNKLQTLDSKTLVLPAHGPVFKNLHLRAQQLIQHHQEQLDLLRTLASQHKEFTAYQALKCLFNRPLSPVESMMALGETLAHLNWLEDNGDLDCQRKNTSGINTYLSRQFADNDRSTL